MSKIRFLNRLLKAHDSELFAEKKKDMIIIYREGLRISPLYEVDNLKFRVLERSPQYVFALTSNWTTTGTPRDWGSEVILDRLKKHDADNREKLFAELEKEERLREESKDRDFKNNTEAWLSDNHNKFKRAFSDVRTCNMDKSERRRRKLERKYGGI